MGQSKSWPTVTIVKLHECHNNGDVANCYSRRCSGCLTPIHPMVFWPSTRLLLVASGLYGLVCHYTKNHWWKNVFRFIGTIVLYFTSAILNSGWIPPSVDRTGNRSFLEILAGYLNISCCDSIAYDGVLIVCNI